MTQELLYTSAPRGLKPGSRGFCTVVSTQAMAAPLAAALESISGYRSVFPPGDPQAHRNPVAWSHLKLSVAGRTQHVLSRVADYDLDYTQRSNKLAHHVVLESKERVTAGPAWVLSQPGFMQTDWDGEPRLLPIGRAVPTGDGAVGVCRAWADLTGDAGWAGVLAEAFLSDPERLAFLIVEPGVDLLPLFTEAISLLPPARRWDVTFSTYFTTIPQGVTCQWRCVLAGSPEANQSRRFVQALRINLCEPLGPATGGPLVEQARSGKRTSQHASSHAVPPPIVFADADGSEEHDLGGTEEQEVGAHDAEDLTSNHPLVNVPPRLPTHPPVRAPIARPERPEEQSTSDQGPHSRWLVILVSLATTLAIFAAGFLYVHFSRQKSKALSTTATGLRESQKGKTQINPSRRPTNPKEIRSPKLQETAGNSKPDQQQTSKVGSDAKAVSQSVNAPDTVVVATPAPIPPPTANNSIPPDSPHPAPPLNQQTPDRDKTQIPAVPASGTPPPTILTNSEIAYTTLPPSKEAELTRFAYVGAHDDSDYHITLLYPLLPPNYPSPQLQSRPVENGLQITQVATTNIVLATFSIKKANELNRSVSFRWGDRATKDSEGANFLRACVVHLSGPDVDSYLALRNPHSTTSSIECARGAPWKLKDDPQFLTEGIRVRDIAVRDKASSFEFQPLPAPAQDVHRVHSVELAKAFSIESFVVSYKFSNGSVVFEYFTSADTIASTESLAYEKIVKECNLKGFKKALLRDIDKHKQNMELIGQLIQATESQLPQPTAPAPEAPQGSKNDAKTPPNDLSNSKIYLKDTLATLSKHSEAYQAAKKQRGMVAKAVAAMRIVSAVVYYQVTREDGSLMNVDFARLNASPKSK